MSEHPQKTSAQLTSTLVSAISNLERRDFELAMGSGLIITIADLDGRNVTEPFMINAEDMQIIKPHIIKSVKQALKLRAERLKSEIRSIKQVVPVDHDEYEEPMGMLPNGSIVRLENLPKIDDDENDGGQGPFR